MHGRQQEFLASYCINFFPNNLRDLLVNPQTQGKQTVMTGMQLTYEPASHQKLVASSLGVSRRIPESRYESSRPAHNPTIRHHQQFSTTITSALLVSFCGEMAERQLPLITVSRTGDLGGGEQHFELRPLVRQLLH
jgi:hypothetical protein